MAADSDMDMMAASNLLADRDEAFNTRYGSYRGWQMAIERVKPIPRHTARLDLTSMVMAAVEGCRGWLERTAVVRWGRLLPFLTYTMCNK